MPDSAKAFVSRVGAVTLIFAAALLFHVVWGAPATILNANTGMFPIWPTQLWLRLLPWGLLAAASVVLTVFLPRGRWAILWLWIYLMVGFQLALFVDDQPLDGRPLQWDRTHALIEVAVLLAGYWLSARLPRKMQQLLLLFVALYAVLNGAVSMWQLELKGNAKPRTERLADNDDDNLAFFFQSEPPGLPDLDHYSTRRNVIVLLIDTFQNDVAEQMLGKNPALARQLTGFTFFRNAASAYPYTAMSVPYIFSQKLYEPGERLTHHRRESNKRRMDYALRERGYTISYLSLLDRSLYVYGTGYTLAVSRRTAVNVLLYRQLPIAVKMAVFGHKTDLVETGLHGNGNLMLDLPILDKLTASVKPDGAQPQFKYVHLWGVHPPSRIGADCKPAEITITRVRMDEQGQCIMGRVGGYLAALRKAGVYDDSRIFIIADHGSTYFPVNGDVTEKPVPWHIRASAQPMILFKEANAKGALRYSDVPVSLGDIRPTVLELPEHNLRNATRANARPRPFGFYEAAKDIWQDTLPLTGRYTIGPDIRNPNDWKRLPD